MVFVKDNFVDLKMAEIYDVRDTNKTEVYCKTVNLNGITPMGPAPTTENILDNTKNGALRKVGEEILQFVATKLGEYGDVSPPRPLPGSGSISWRCSTATSGNDLVFMLLVPQKTQLKLRLRTETGAWGDLRLPSGNLWNDEAQQRVKEAFQQARSGRFSESEQSL